MARKGRGEGGGESWLNTYADMVTLLLTFFIVMLSMSTIEVEKFDALVKSFNPGYDKGVSDGGESDFIVEDPMDGLSVDKEMTMESLFELIQEYIQENNMQNDMSASLENGLIYLRFSSAMLFVPDSYTMLSGSRPLMDFVGNVLKLYEEKIKSINILGHTARTGRINSNVSDWLLSGERAATVAMYFEDIGVNKNKMITFGYGDNYPIADNATESGRSQNRRVELVIVGMESMDNFDIYGMLSGVIDDNDMASGDVLTPRPPAGEPAAGTEE